MKAIILAAGIGSRLGKPFPKPLTRLTNGKTIMETQIDSLLKYIDITDIYIVVGFKKELIMEAFPDANFVYNQYFDQTNTSKSLLKAFKRVRNEDVIWLNGDVVFDRKVIERLLNEPRSCVVVNNEKCGEEEVKYSLDQDGKIKYISKEVQDALGEAVGINKLISDDVELVTSKLEICEDNDYFEKGIELSIEDGLNIYPINIGDLMCMEIDFEEDLEKVNTRLEMELGEKNG